MTLIEAIEKMIFKNGSIYLDKTTGWYEGEDEYQTGGESIEYVLSGGKIYKLREYIDDEIDELVADSREITVTEIAAELLASGVTIDEVISGGVIDKSSWENMTSYDA